MTSMLLMSHLNGHYPRDLIGTSTAMARVRKLISDVASTDARVLILGESGTGKELVARAIHAQSRRASRLFVPVNMAALPGTLAESVLFGHEKGAFTGADSPQAGWCETADKGTLFLDEIGEMEIGLQAKLLRFLQENSFQRVGSGRVTRVDTRIIAATNGDPGSLIARGKLRADLFYRLNVFPLSVPPLRERPTDIAELIEVFLQRSKDRYSKHIRGVTPSALELLRQYGWPGNVRELENLIERLVIISRRDVIDVEDLPAEVVLSAFNPARKNGVSSCTLRPIDQIERQAIIDALHTTKGNAVSAARLLGVGQATVYRKIKRYGISLDDHRGH